MRHEINYNYSVRIHKNRLKYHKGHTLYFLIFGLVYLYLSDIFYLQSFQILVRRK
jgi:hypothetical protein